jgi:hypothetical protein
MAVTHSAIWRQYPIEIWSHIFRYSTSDCEFVPLSKNQPPFNLLRTSHYFLNLGINIPKWIQHIQLEGTRCFLFGKHHMNMLGVVMKTVKHPIDVKVVFPPYDEADCNMERASTIGRKWLALCNTLAPTLHHLRLIRVTGHELVILPHGIFPVLQSFTCISLVGGAAGEIKFMHGIETLRTVSIDCYHPRFKLPWSTLTHVSLGGAVEYQIPTAQCNSLQALDCWGVMPSIENSGDPAFQIDGCNRLSVAWSTSFSSVNNHWPMALVPNITCLRLALETLDDSVPTTHQNSLYEGLRQCIHLQELALLTSYLDVTTVTQVAEAASGICTLEIGIGVWLVDTMRCIIGTPIFPRVDHWRLHMDDASESVQELFDLGWFPLSRMEMVDAIDDLANRHHKHHNVQPVCSVELLSYEGCWINQVYDLPSNVRVISDVNVFTHSLRLLNLLDSSYESDDSVAGTLS